MGQLTEGNIGYLHKIGVFDALATEFTHLTDLRAKADEVTIDSIEGRDVEVMVFAQDGQPFITARKVVARAGVIRWSIENGHRHDYEHAIFNGHIDPLVDPEQVATIHEYAGNLEETAKARAQVEAARRAVEEQYQLAEERPAYYLG